MRIYVQNKLRISCGDCIKENTCSQTQNKSIDMSCLDAFSENYCKVLFNLNDIKSAFWHKYLWGRSIFLLYLSTKYSSLLKVATVRIFEIDSFVILPVSSKFFLSWPEKPANIFVWNTPPSTFHIDMKCYEILDHEKNNREKKHMFHVLIKRK